MQERETLNYPADYMHGDEAAKIFNEYRSDPDIDDRTRIEDIDIEFPWLKSELGGAAVSLVRLGENRAGTFKVRGAVVGAHKLLERHGAIKTASAGNAARATALVAKMHDVPAKIMVPRSAPLQKREGIKELWPNGLLKVEVVGENFDQTLQHLLAEEDEYGFLPPFDDPNVIMGQGTVMDEEEMGNIDILAVPVGGGGLIAGVVKRAYEQGLDLKVHPIEMNGSDSFSRSMAAGEVVAATNPNQLCGGSAVRKISELALAICMHHRDMIVLESDEDKERRAKAGKEPLQTTSDSELHAFIDSYTQHRANNWLEGEVDPYEPTTLAPMTKVVELARNYPGKRIAVLGTGQNAPLKPSRQGAHKNRAWAGTFPK